MYTNKNYENVINVIEKVKEDATIIYNKNYEPNIDEMNDVINIIKNYIIKHKRIMYGGFAQNLQIINKNKDDGIYKKINGLYYNLPNIADIEFYSPEPLVDVINLSDELFKMNHKHVEGKEGIHEATYKIFVNFINYCDISYMPYNLYKNVPTIKIDNIICIHPHFMLIDSFRILSDPMISYWRLDKMISRCHKLLGYYPFYKNPDYKLNIKLKYDNQDILRFIRHKIIHNSKYVVVGFYAYNYYINKISKKNIINDIPYYEIITDDLKNNAKFIYIKLKNKFKSITTKEYYPFFDYLDRRIEYYYNNNLILILYGNNQRCIIYNKSDKKKTYFGAYNLLILYYLCNHYYNKINKINDNSIYIKLINNLNDTKNKYLNKKNISNIDNSVFQEFIFQCTGYPINPMRQSFIQAMMKKKSGKKTKFRYGPTEKKGKIPSYKFKNMSGNQISNKKNLIL